MPPLTTERIPRAIAMFQRISRLGSLSRALSSRLLIRTPRGASAFFTIGSHLPQDYPLYSLQTLGIGQSRFFLTPS